MMNRKGEKHAEHKKDEVFEFSNLQELKECKPFSEPFVLSKHGMRE